MPSLMNKPRVGVVLFQLGGPDSPEAVEPFLYNLFCDPDIINFMGAWLARRPLARWIARRRAQVVRDHYNAIGGQSPIRALTERQARKLEAALAAEFDIHCWVAMRYWHPLTAEAAAAVQSASLDHLILLPLYPQYSFATTVEQPERVAACVPSSSGRAGRTHDRGVSHSSAVHSGPGGADCHHAARISIDPEQRAPGLQRARVAHEPDRARRPVPAPRARRPSPRCWPAAAGRTRTRSAIRAASAGRSGWSRRCTRPSSAWRTPAKSILLVVPVSFVTEHIETLHEINIETREEAVARGR